MMSTNKTALVGETSKIQANVGFRSPPTLLDLETLLRVICEESAEYDLFKVRNPFRSPSGVLKAGSRLGKLLFLLLSDTTGTHRVASRSSRVR